MEGVMAMALWPNLHTWYLGSNKSMLRTTNALLFLLLLVLGEKVYAFAEFNDIDLLSTPTRNFSDSRQKPKAFALELMHSHHKDLPYVEPNLTFTKRIELLVRSSEERLSYLVSQISRKNNTYQMEHSYTLEARPKQHAYMVLLTIGTPPRKVLVEVDITFDLTWLHCSPCQECLEIHPQGPGKLTFIYDPTTSSSFTPAPCDWRYCNTATLKGRLCGDGGKKSAQCVYSYPLVARRAKWELNGDFASEDFLLPDGQNQTTHNKLYFGCGRRNKGLFRASHGVVGLAGRGTPISILKQLGMSTFSYCLVSFHSITQQISPLILGNEGFENLNPRFVPAMAPRAYPNAQHMQKIYYLKMKAVRVNYQKLKIPENTFSFTHEGNGGFVMDIGITFSYLSSDLYNALKMATHEALVTYRRVNPWESENPPLEVCYDIANEDNTIFPTMALEFDNGVLMDLPSDNIFMRHGKSNIACLAFKENLDSLNKELITWGNYQQQNFNFLYRKDDIGFVHVQACS